MEAINQVVSKAIVIPQHRMSQNSEPSSESYLEKRCRWFNESPGNLDGPSCPLCLNKGRIAVPEGTTMAMRKCACVAQRLSAQRMQRSGLGDLLQQCTFDSFRVSHSWQENLLNTCKAFITQGQGHWLYLGGQVGCGKTHLCTAVVGALMERGLSARYVQWRQDIVHIKASVTNSEEYAKLVEPLKETDVLYIDDLFKVKKGDRPTSADVGVAFEILNHRYNQRNKATILSGELTLDELISIDEAVGSRIYERTKEFCLIIKGDPYKNFRMRV